MLSNSTAGLVRRLNPAVDQPESGFVKNIRRANKPRVLMLPPKLGFDGAEIGVAFGHHPYQLAVKSNLHLKRRPAKPALVGILWP